MVVRLLLSETYGVKEMRENVMRVKEKCRCPSAWTVCAYGGIEDITE